MNRIKTLESRSILLVDDDRLNLSTMSNSLESAGFIAHTVESVDDAEHWLDHHERPDLVILDMRMPQRNGLELTPKLNAMNYIPFILLTAYSDTDIVAESTKAGAMGYLVKPVDTSQLIPAIMTAISRAQDIANMRRTQEMLQSALDSDRAVNVAIGIVMDQHQLNHDAAFDKIRHAARAQHLKLVDFAAMIVNSRELLNMNAGMK